MSRSVISDVFDVGANSARRSACGTSTDAPRTWRDDAVCRHHDPDIFYPVDGSGYGLAARICLSCPVRQPCRDYAIKHEVHGFWGGLSPEERRSLRRPNVRRNAAEDRNHLAVVDEAEAVGQALRGVLAILRSNQ